MSETNPSNRVVERQNKLIDEYAKYADWEERYKKIIARGKSLPELRKELYDEKFKVRGCQSQVWLYATQHPVTKDILFQADSDALIAKGLIALLVDTYSQSTSEEILTAPTDFIKKLGFEAYLSPSRANGLYSMLKQILLYATAFQKLNHAKSAAE